MEYSKKIQQLQDDIQQLEYERIESLKKADSVVQKTRVDETFKKKLKELEDKLHVAKTKEREQ